MLVVVDGSRIARGPALGGQLANPGELGGRFAVRRTLRWLQSRWQVASRTAPEDRWGVDRVGEAVCHRLVVHTPAAEMDPRAGRVTLHRPPGGGEMLERVLEVVLGELDRILRQ